MTTDLFPPPTVITNDDQNAIDILFKQADDQLHASSTLLKGIHTLNLNTNLNLPKFLSSFYQDQHQAKPRPPNFTWQQFVDQDLNTYESTPATIKSDLNDLQSKTALLEYQMIDHMARSELLSRLLHSEQPDWADADMNMHVMSECHQLESHLETLNVQMKSLSSELSETIKELNHAETSLSRNISLVEEKLDLYRSNPDPTTIITDAHLAEKSTTLQELNEVLARDEAELEKILPLESTRPLEIAQLEQELKGMNEENNRLADEAHQECEKIKSLELQMAGMDPKVPLAVESRRLMLAAQLRVAGATDVMPLHYGSNQQSSDPTRNALIQAIHERPDSIDQSNTPQDRSFSIVVDLMAGSENGASVSRHLVIQEPGCHSNDLGVHLLELPKYQPDLNAVVIGSRKMANHGWDFARDLDRMHTVYLTPTSVDENQVPPLSALYPRISASTRLDNLVLLIEASDEFICRVIDKRSCVGLKHTLSLPNGFWQVWISCKAQKNSNVANKSTPEVVLVVCPETGHVVKYGVRGTVWSTGIQDVAINTQSQIQAGSHEAVFALLRAVLS